MSHVTTVIIGAGQCGLAMSRELSRRSVDHVVLERGRIGNSWHAERWDSLRLLTPNWMSAPPGHSYGGTDPGRLHVLRRFRGQPRARGGRSMARRSGRRRTVLSLDAFGSGYRVQTDQGAIVCDSVVVATGECARAAHPGVRQRAAALGRATHPAELQAPRRRAGGRHAGCRRLGERAADRPRACGSRPAGHACGRQPPSPAAPLPRRRYPLVDAPPRGLQRASYRKRRPRPAAAAAVPAARRRSVRCHARPQQPAGPRRRDRRAGSRR